MLSTETVKTDAILFDDISIGYGYVGDLTTPNFTGRLHRLAQSNFHRFILKKNVGERVWTSVDYAFQSGVQTWREAIRIRVTELRVIDTFHVEIYEISGLHSGQPSPSSRKCAWQRIPRQQRLIAN